MPDALCTTAVLSYTLCALLHTQHSRIYRFQIMVVFLEGERVCMMCDCKGLPAPRGVLIGAAHNSKHETLHHFQALPFMFICMHDTAVPGTKLYTNCFENTHTALKRHPRNPHTYPYLTGKEITPMKYLVALIALVHGTAAVSMYSGTQHILSFRTRAVLTIFMCSRALFVSTYQEYTTAVVRIR